VACFLVYLPAGAVPMGGQVPSCRVLHRCVLLNGKLLSLTLCRLLLSPIGRS